MVFNTAKIAMLPHHKSSTLSVLSAQGNALGKGMKLIGGSGVGAVLLRKGGPGGASSYMDMDDYIATTGINPYARSGVAPPPSKKGSGIPKSITSKLSKLNIAPPTDGPKRKNIIMSF